MKSIVTATLLILMMGQIMGQSFQFGLDHSAIFVQDMEKSVAFYSDVMGLREIETPPAPENIRWFAIGESQQLQLIERTGMSVEKNKSVHFALRTDHLDDFMNHLKKHKVSFGNWPGDENTYNTRQDGIRQIYFQDPDGFWIEVNDASAHRFRQ